MKVVINKCYGGFGLSDEALQLYNELSGLSIKRETEIPRHDPHLVEVVERLGEAANSGFSELKVVDIPDDVEYDICEYDGMEWIAETHRTWE